MQNKMSSFPARLTEEGLEAVLPHAKSFYPQQSKGWADSARDQLHMRTCNTYTAGGEPK